MVFGALGAQRKEAAHLAGHVLLGAKEIAAEVEVAFTIGVALVTDTLGHMHSGDVAVVIRHVGRDVDHLALDALYHSTDVGCQHCVGLMGCQHRVVLMGAIEESVVRAVECDHHIVAV